MIPYEVVIPSAARPHLLEQVLGTLLARVDQLPIIVRIHNDARWPGRREAIEHARRMVPDSVPVVIEHDDPPIKHGPALQRLLSQVQTEYVLYSQDDHRVVRPLPIAPALRLLRDHELNQIRFNKRDTMDKKGPEGREFHKIAFWFACPDLPAAWQYPLPKPGGMPVLDLATGQPTAPIPGTAVPLCAADHWYFQTGLWRVAAIKPVVDWWADPAGGGRLGAFAEHTEVKINDVFNGKYQAQVHFPQPPVPCCEPAQWNDPLVRAAVHRTFIWGPIGEPAFVQHIGHQPADWALERANRDPQRARPA